MPGNKTGEKPLHRASATRSSCHLAQPVSEGGCLGVLAPAGVVDKVALEKGLEVLLQLGFRVRVAEQVAETHRFFAGNDALRSAALETFFTDPEIEGILMARGGYGCLRLLETLDASVIRSHPKRVMGFSDGSVLLAFLTGVCGLAAFHGPVVTQLPRLGKEDLDAVKRAFCGDGKGSISFSQGQVLRAGTVCGPFAGGNLATLCHMIGTPWMPQLSGCILLLEEINEPPYKLDRMLCQLRLSGALEGICGVVLGSFTACGNQDSLLVSLMEHLPKGVPVVTGLPVGHDARNHPLPMGVTGRLDTGALVVSWGQQDD